MANEKSTAVRMPQDDHDALEQIAKAQDRSVAQIIRYAVRDYIVAQKKKK